MLYSIMCGIIGYIGGEKAVQILISGLERLEYRGYDSAGIAVSYDGKIYLAKAKGRVAELEKKLSGDCKGNFGIAHTRWATHGEPSERNAHPHSDCKEQVFVCHNGIIENYREIKEALILRNHIFKSETDTEVLSHLIEENLRYTGFEESVARALKLVRGTYGLVVMASGWPDQIIAARNSSPLVIGIGKGENFISSDVSAILGRTREVIYLNDGELAVLTKDSVKLFNILKFKYLNTFSLKEMFYGNKKFKKQKISKSQYLDISERKEKLKWNINDAQKSGYPHFMLKEIFEQPASISNSLRGRLVKNKGLVKLGGLETMKERLRNINRLIITGCGTAYLAGLVGKYMIEEYVGLPCDVELASELHYRNFLIDNQNLAMVAISQSGETADTLAVLRKIKEQYREKNGKYEQNSNRNKNEKNFVESSHFSKSPFKNDILTLGIVNAVGSTVARETSAGVYNHAGPEIGVASTKAFTSQLTVLALLTLFLGRERGTISLKMGKTIAEEIGKLPQLVNQILKQGDNIKEIAKEYQNFNNFLYIGRKYNFPVAFEGALKLKEISYIHAEGCGAGEMKHGPIAMIDENFPTIAIAPVDSVYEKMVSNIEEIKARQGKVIVITTEGNEKIEHIANDWLYIPKTLEMLTPILSVIPLQLFAYYMSILRGFDPDKPRNLAKSVTVE